MADRRRLRPNPLSFRRQFRRPPPAVPRSHSSLRDLMAAPVEAAAAAVSRYGAHDEEEGQVYLTSPLYHSVIMTPVPYPFCFARMTPLYDNIVREGFDISAWANAMGGFLNCQAIHTLYLIGSVRSNATRFFLDLRRALLEEPEVGFYCGFPPVPAPKPKRVVLLVGYPTMLPTHAWEHRGFNFVRNDCPYDSFTRQHLASLIANGNTERGPVCFYECQSETGFLCVRRRYLGVPTCGVCFRIPTKSRLLGPNPYDLRPVRDRVEYVDEGVVVEPMGIREQLFEHYVSDSEPLTPSESDGESEIDW
ncbi:protein ORF52 [Pigeon adenovirus 1]|uniref:Protein ORF52 n=1 Tax=Pigeon adenovirus 1 TaxID=764030 RepID=X5M4V3_9ADEN|nr:protein ORF52 [Pigeon adenovirus 1]CDO33888.1 protein ORF52 [Pigeon adenovirus 1]